MAAFLSATWLVQPCRLRCAPGLSRRSAHRLRRGKCSTAQAGVLPMLPTSLVLEGPGETAWRQQSMI